MSRLLSSKILQTANPASKGKILSTDHTDDQGCFAENSSRNPGGAHAPSSSDKGRIRRGERAALRALAQRSPMHRGGFSKSWNANSRVCHRACVFGVFGGGVEPWHARHVRSGLRTNYQLPVRRSVGEGGSAFPSLRPRRRCGTSPGRWFRARSGRWPRRSCRRTTRCNGCCRCSCGRGCCRRRSRWRWRHSRCRRRCRSAAWRHTNKIDVLLVLSPAGVKVVRCRVCDIASGVIGHNGDVITYLVLLWPAFQRSEGIAHSYVGRPGNTAIGAVGVEQLRVDVVRGISRIQPHRINPTVGRYSDGSEPMPFVRVDRDHR